MSMNPSTYIPVLAVIAAFWASSAAAGDVEFVRDVQPIFQKHCYTCHGQEKQRSGLRLDIKSEAFRGGDGYGPSILAGDPAESPLLQLVSSKDDDTRMPPEGEGLSPAEVTMLTKWIAAGAYWPDGVDSATLEDRRDHWSFAPVVPPALPAVHDDAWPRGDIDRFVLARLEKEALQPAPEAERTTWLRRAYYDLTGLPPSPAEIDAFLQDQRGDAYQRVVERLLHSPHYGQRWAQHWLDVVRYADTHGFEVNTERPNAWPYRDYVIQAFNNDTPYDRFVQEQLVGDALGRDAATGFLMTSAVLLPGQIGKDDASKRLARQDELGEIVINTGQTFLGLSIGCARCHDHKFDPVSARDYYAMQAFFAGVQYGDREIHSPEADAARSESIARRQQIDAVLARLAPLANTGTERPPVNAQANIERFAPLMAKRVRFVIHSTNNLKPCLDELEVFDTSGTNIALARSGARATASGSTVAADRHELRFINDGQFGNSRSWMSDEVGKGWVELEFPEEQTIERIVWGRDRQGKYSDRLPLRYTIEVAGVSGQWRTVADAEDRRAFQPGQDATELFLLSVGAAHQAEAKRLLAEKNRVETELRVYGEGGQRVYAGIFTTPEPVHVLYRGDPEQPREEVPPAVPEALGDVELSQQATDQQRRQALAEWITGPDHPLTARVMVNRIWQGHFGIGLVETSSDFGRSGARPTHPELLDWLAAEFVRSGWSIKHMHRLIINSATYRQSSRIDAAGQALDADVRLLWRFPTRRLEAEAIRDSMLEVSGRLNLTVGGPGFDLFRSRGGLSGFPPMESFTGDGLRRMVYAHKVRMERDAVFGAFDCPDAGQSTPRRRQSTTPIQALNLLNSRFTIEESRAFAARVQAEVGNDVERQIDHAFRLALGRTPTAVELHDAAPVIRKHGLSTLCRVLFNSNEFLFLP